MGFNNMCNTGLVLGLSLSSAVEVISTSTVVKKPVPGICNFEPSLTLGLSGKGETNNCEDHREGSCAASSFSNVSLKRERDQMGSSSKEVVVGRREMVNFGSSTLKDEDDYGAMKLRLTKAQSALLDESFKVHTTLNPKQKQKLARDLKLRPQQIEVWFQNRRARTKIKQTEVDFEDMKKCFEILTNENRRLKKELQELKALKQAQPFLMQLPAATLTTCPSCERVGGDISTSTITGTTTATIKPSSFSSTLASKPHFYNSFTSPSTAY